MLLPASVAGLGWLGMQAAHECGHVLGAWLTGGTVSKVVLHPLTFSRTDLAANPHPLLVSWAGPIGGVVFPAILFAIAGLSRRRFTWIARTFLGFCLLANGAYLSGGALWTMGDPADMIALGAPRWLPVLIGLVLLGAGLCCWNGQGRFLGLAPGSVVNRGVAAILAGCLIAVIVLELMLSQPF